MITPQEAAAELLARRKARKSFADFCRYVAPEEPPAAHHLLICDALDRVIDGDLKRLMIFMPPGSAKSTYATVRFPAYFVGRRKAEGIVSASYNVDLATQFGRKVRNLVRSPEYLRVFPDVALSADSRAKGEWNTTGGGFYFATGIEGGINGRRGALGVIDDPLKGQSDADSARVRDTTWAWYISDFRSRLWPTAPQVIINTRWNLDDLCGRILPDDWNGESGWITAKDGEQWYVICLPAEARANDILGRAPGEWLWTDWFGVNYWEQTKKTACLFDVRTWNSLYQQMPADIAGTYFQRSWFDNRYEVLPKNLNSYVSGDFAATDGKGDYTELAAWGVCPDDVIYVRDWFSGQVTSDVWTDELLAMTTANDALMFIGEAGPIRRSVEPWLEKRMRETGEYVNTTWLTAPNKESDSLSGKAVAARSFQAMCRQGRVRFPRTQWAERVIDQLCQFPGGKFDDAVDCCSLFGRHIASTWAAVRPELPKTKLIDQWNAPLKISDFLERKKAARW